MAPGLARVTCEAVTVSILLALAGASHAFTMTAFEAKVVGVADGDTLTVLREKAQIRIRLHGVDAPERGQPFGTRARQFTAELAFGQVVRIEPTDRDPFGRIVAHVILPDGRNLNRELVREGWAWWFRRYAPKNQELERLETESQSRAARAVGRSQAGAAVGVAATPGGLEIPSAAMIRPPGDLRCPSSGLKECRVQTDRKGAPFHARP